jgi:hypothetical protein
MKMSDVFGYRKPLNRKGLYSQWTVTCGDVSAVNASKEEAEKDVLCTLQVVLTGDYKPVIVWKQPYYAICYRTVVSGWCYCIRAVGENVNNGGWTSGFSDKQECIDYATRHLADYER